MGTPPPVSGAPRVRIPAKPRPDKAAEELRRYRALYEIGLTMASENEFEALMILIMAKIREVMGADRCTLFYYDDVKERLWSKIAQGLDQKTTITLDLETAKKADKPGLAPVCFLSGEVINCMDAHEDPRFDTFWDVKTGYRTRAVLCVPLKNRSGEALGVIQVLNKLDESTFGENEVELLTLIANQASLQLETTFLYDELKKTFESTISALAGTMDAKDQITSGHTQRVMELSVELARDLGASERELEVMRYAGLLHDIGKIAVRDSVLNKPGKLTDEEYKEMKSHVDYTQAILDRIHFSKPLRRIPDFAAMHHERMDGKGYAKGLKGENIPREARTMHVADTFDALTSVRQYKDRMPFKKAMSIMKNEAGTDFDPVAVGALLRLKLVTVAEILSHATPVRLTEEQQALFSEITVGDFTALLEAESVPADRQKLVREFQTFYEATELMLKKAREKVTSIDGVAPAELPKDRDAAPAPGAPAPPASSTKGGAGAP